MSSPPRPRLSRRVAQVSWLLARQAVRLAGVAASSTVDGHRFGPRRDAWLVETVTELGPAFVKAAQLLSTRRDLLPPRLCEALGRLHDDVRPIPAADLATALSGRLAPTTAEAVRRSGHPVASGSIACVYRARLDDGRDVAIKVRRPGLEPVLLADLELMRRAAALLARVPALRDVPVTAIVTQLAESIHGQLDLVREAAHLGRLADHLAELPGVRVPLVHGDLSGADVLVMEYVDDLRRRLPADLAEPARAEAVVRALRSVYRMLFFEGLVHCDLHPGNLYFQADGSVVIVDAGFMVQMSQHVRDKFSVFFYCMSTGDAAACADIVLSTAMVRPDSDVDGFGRDLRALVEAHTGRKAAQFDLVRFATRLFDIQRRYRLYADPQFVFPILSLLVLEGTVRDFAPDVDFQREAMPFLVSALMDRVATM